MSADLRKGWCPGALRPMAAADGLVVRLRPTGGILAAATARTLADLATRHGNGRLDLTSRANLQMRGVSETSLPKLLKDLRALGLVDAEPGAEAVRNVVASPLAGFGGGLDIRPLVAALETRLSGTRELHALPRKFGFLIDDGGSPSLADVGADVRFDWCAKQTHFTVALGGTRDGAVFAGPCAANDLVDCAEAIARGAIAGFARFPEARRMRALCDMIGEKEVLRLCGRRPPPIASARDRKGQERGNTPPTAGCDALQLFAPYGRLDTGMLDMAARLAATGLAELRLTPWRSLLLPGIEGHNALDPATRAGWIVDSADPRLAIAACVGAPECARATTRTREDADALADLAPRLSRDTPSLHVSGCVKGCAHAGAASVVLVGRDGRYDLVHDGHPGDAPTLRDLDVGAARAAIAARLER